ncbi:MAG: proteasome lid subunit RPN8/RPN11 [Planctomycetota bacterium]
MNSELVLPIEIERSALLFLREQARDAYPREACGVLSGIRNENRLWIRRVFSVSNLARDSRSFDLDPGQLVARSNEASELGEELLGVWHTHPDQRPELSDRDRHHASNEWEQVVVSVNAQSETTIGWYGYRFGEWVATKWREVELGSHV